MGEIRKHHPPSISSRTDLLPEIITFHEGGRWSRRTRLEKSLIIILVSVVLLVTGLVATYLAFLYTSTSTHTEICGTADCLQTAAELAESVDPSTEPCQDFYQFACGRWLQSNSMPADRSSIEALTPMRSNIKDVLKEALIEKDDMAPLAVGQARTYFTSCENTDRIEKRGVKPLLDLFNATGEVIFPTLNPAWSDHGLSLTEVVRLADSVGDLGMTRFLPFAVHSDPQNSSSNTILMSQADLVLGHRGYYLGPRDSSVLAHYEKAYTHLLTLLGAQPDIAARDAKDVVDFEIQLANATDRREALRDVGVYRKKMTVNDLALLYPDFDWLGRLGRWFGRVNITVTEGERVWVATNRYYNHLFPLLRNTPTRTLLNYCMWGIAFYLSPMMNREVRDVALKLRNELSGVKRHKERWELCLAGTESVLPDAVGRLYVDKMFPPSSKQRVESLISNIRRSFGQMIREQDWMGDSTKQAAIDKLEMVRFKIGYPDYLLNDTALNAKTENVTVREDFYFENYLDITTKKGLQMLETLRQPVDKEKWGMSAATLNAYYSATDNEIGFPAAILQPPMFSPAYPDSINFGSLGSVIGHELTHGFDDMGSHFDKNGNLSPWWGGEDWLRFQNKTACMRDQYSQYTVTSLNMKVNGKLTLGENIADNGGLKQAFRAYRSAVAERGREEPNLPVLPYTHDQLFFIGYAQIYCGKVRDEMMRVQLSSQYHSPFQFRVLGPLQNNADFARAFHCTKGSPMNPQHKCHVW